MTNVMFMIFIDYEYWDMIMVLLVIRHMDRIPGNGVFWIRRINKLKEQHSMLCLVLSWHTWN
jgi:hypothetical protein